MKIVRASVGRGFWGFGMLVFVCGFLVLPAPMAAQCNGSTTITGFNAVYGNCSGSVAVQGGFAMVDATQFNSSDICLAMQSIYGISASGNNTYNPSNSNGVVIDARGYTGTLSCLVNPWVNPTYQGANWNWTESQSFSTVILLPAGNITISQTLALPANTKLVGEGPGLTTLVPASTFFSNCPTCTDMIDMGTSSASGYPTICPGSPHPPFCYGVVIEHLTVNGNGQSLNGIVNHYSQELSNVNDVVLTNFIGGTGLWLDNRSNNSGPYTDISYSGSGVCAQIFDNVGSEGTINQTRGIHGLTCTMGGSENTPAIYLDAPNNSLEDVSISGNSTQDGILIGSQANAYNNVIFNVRGSGLNNVIHICGSTTCPGGTAFTVTDLTILGVTRSGGTNSVEDNLTNASLTDANLGMYIVGEPVLGNGAGIGYSRFTTSTNSGSTAGAVSWLVGPNAPSSGGSCPAGSLYSCTNGSNCNVPYTLWGCIGSGTWNPIK